MDKGPWKMWATDKGLCVASDDFEHDVVLYVTGDFEDEFQRANYCEWLRDTLNAATNTVTVSDTPPDQPTAVKPQHQCAYCAMGVARFENSRGQWIHEFDDGTRVECTADKSKGAE